MNDDIKAAMTPHFNAIVEVAIKGDAIGRVNERERIRDAIRLFETEYMKTATDTAVLDTVMKTIAEIRRRIG